MKINGAQENLPFISNIGSPLGDSLTSILFIVYLEQALREERKIRSSPSSENERSTEAVYATTYVLSGVKSISTKYKKYILEGCNLILQ